MGGLYRIFAKAITNLISKTCYHPMHYGLIRGRNILHNILNVQMAMDYEKESKLEIVMIQLDIEKVMTK